MQQISSPTPLPMTRMERALRVLLKPKFKDKLRQQISQIPSDELKRSHRRVASSVGLSHLIFPPEAFGEMAMDLWDAMRPVPNAQVDLLVYRLQRVDERNGA